MIRWIMALQSLETGLVSYIQPISHGLGINLMNNPHVTPMIKRFAFAFVVDIHRVEI
ncbi:MAG: hypothetical protein WAM14_11880 [Candidatus Nitrosopolaris sp.]